MTRLGSRILAKIFLLALFSMSGCSGLYETLAARLTPSPIVMIPTGSLSPQASSTTPEISSTAPLPDSCAFVWSNRSLPELSTEVNQAFRKHGLAEVEVEASAYGEDCLDPATNEVVRFTAIQTDFFLNVAVESIENHQVLGDWIEKSILVLNEFPPGKAPGPNLGMIGLIFTSSSDSVNLSFPISKCKNLLAEGLKGGELFDALSGD
jgi:hypothetical protein